MIRWKRPGNWRCLWRICHELMHGGKLALWGAAGPSDRRDTRATPYMPSSPNGVKELNSLSFMGRANYRVIRGHWIGDAASGSRPLSALPSRLSWPAQSIRAPEPATKKARGRPLTAPLITVLVDWPGSLLQRSRCRPAELPARRSVTMSEVTSARFAGCERSRTPPSTFPATW